ncbi:hypothetical protein VPH35_053938 [Triticum aestivum]|uniref:protein HESO1 n=1 Tax=Triticum aestivum TaxID=4565 RepID=UPI001D0304C3|nr:protein HESO1-like [Triticum aestivum]
MIEIVQDFYLVGECIEEVLSVIKPTEDDRNKRLETIQEFVNSIYSAADLEDASAKPFGSFASNLYAKSGDLDVSVELSNDPDSFTTKKKRKALRVERINALSEVRRVLQIKGVARDVQFIPTARVPVLSYVSNKFGISCDISIDNYRGRIKSRVLYWLNTLDKRFGDMVLLVKEWAKAQNINDPKKGTLSSYSLCLLVIFYFQTCTPAIFPPMNKFFDVEDPAGMRLIDEKHVDEVCAANINKFQLQNIGQRNHKSLCALLVGFFSKFCGMVPSDVSTYTGQPKRTNDKMKSYRWFVEDPFDRSDNAARTVDALQLGRIANAFTNAAAVTFYSYDPDDRNELLTLLCTPEVRSKLGARLSTSPQQGEVTGALELVAATPHDNHYCQRSTGSKRKRSNS